MRVLVISGAVLLLSVSFQKLVMLWVWLVSHHMQRGPLSLASLPCIAPWRWLELNQAALGGANGLSANSGVTYGL